MEKLSMCRICLIENVKMYSLISANLQELYKRLTDMPFMTKDKKLVQVCYLCHARLQNCHRLQATCLRSEEFFNNIMANNEIKQMESQDLNTLKTVHPLISISCEPSTSKDPDDKIDENNDFKFGPSEITFDVKVKEEFFEDDSFINEKVEIELEPIVEDEDICTEDGDMSDNYHTMQGTKLEHDTQLNPVEIVLERIDSEQFEIGASAGKNSKIDLNNGNPERTISIDIPELEVTVLQNKNIEKKILATERSVIAANKNIVKQISFIDKYKKNKVMDTCSDVHSKIKDYKCKVCGESFTRNSSLVRHIRVHTGERPYRCVTCNQTFTRKSYLIIHTRIHTGERSTCNVCGKSFTSKNNLITHTRIHTGERYKCNVCGKTFTQKCNLVRHNTRKHSDEGSC